MIADEELVEPLEGGRRPISLCRVDFGGDDVERLGGASGTPAIPVELSLLGDRGQCLTPVAGIGVVVSLPR